MNKLQAYKLTQELLKNKEELLKYPDAFKGLLEDLRKATIDDVPDDEEPQDPEYGEQDSLMDDNAGNRSSDEDDDASQFLKEKEAAAKAPASKEAAEPGQKKYTRDWEPRSDYTPEHKAAIEKHMSNGYSHREAERMAGAHKGPNDFVSAMKSGIAPSMMSDKFMSDLKPLAKQWLEEADKQDKLKADPESNTVKRQSGKLIEAYDKHTGDYNKAHNDFLSSDAVKGLKGKDRHQAIQKWKSDWKQQNPQHEEGMQQISEAQKQYAYDQPKAKTSMEDRMKHIMMGGQSMPTEMSSAEAMQHLGGGKSEEGYQGTIVQDPSASFAARNPQLLAAMKPEQQERLKRVDSAAKTVGKVRIRKGGNT